MAFQAVPDGLETVFNATQNGVPIVNVYHTRFSIAHTVELCEDLNELFYDWWLDNISIVTSNSYVLQNITTTSLELSTGPQAVLNLTSGNQGALTGEQVAGNAAVVMSWRTASIGRSFRGRTYLGGLDAAATDTAQTITSSFATAISDAAVDLIDRLIAADGALAVLSRYASGVLRVVGLLTDIISVIVDLKVDSQRRRTAN